MFHDDDDVVVVVEEKFKNLDERTRKLMTLHKALHPWQGGRRELSNTEDNVDVVIQELEDSTKKNKGILITTAKGHNKNSRRTNRKTGIKNQENKTGKKDCSMNMSEDKL